MVTFKHPETGATIEAPDEPGVADLYKSQGWEPAEDEAGEPDPAFGTYDGDAYKDADDEDEKDGRRGKGSRKS